MTRFTASHRGGTGSPLVCVHGFTDTWRSWELVLPRLERSYDVFAPTLPGHAGGPPLETPTAEGLVDGVERILDQAGIGSAHLVGNSLGGLIVLELAARGRADTVVAFAPAGGWLPGDASFQPTMAHFRLMLELLPAALPYVDAIVATAEGRRRATEMTTVNYEHIPPDLIAHQILGVAGCTAAQALIEHGLAREFALDAARIRCPVRVVWGCDDRLLPWPAAAQRFRQDWLPHADWVELPGVGHCPQLDVPVEAADLICSFS